MNLKHTNVFSQLQTFEKEIARLEGRILELETSINKLIEIERNHLIRLKNGEQLSDDFVQNGRAYLDLSPDKAFKMYRNPNFDFILIDVTSIDFLGKTLVIVLSKYRQKQLHFLLFQKMEQLLFLRANFS